MTPQGIPVTLTLTHATMVEAVQGWIDARFADPKPRVGTITVNGQNRSGSDCSFVVTFEPPEVKPA